MGTSFVLTAMSLTLGIFFILVGTLKLTPSVNGEIYKEMRKTYIRNSKVFPFVKQSGWKPNPHSYRKIIGSLEVLCGVIMAVIPGPLKEAANVILLIVMINDIYTHYALGEGLEKMSPAMVFTLLLACRLVIHLQARSRKQEAVTRSTYDSTCPTEEQILDEKKEQ